jgi:hypothetical protein
MSSIETDPIVAIVRNENQEDFGRIEQCRRGSDLTLVVPHRTRDAMNHFETRILETHDGKRFRLSCQQIHSR